MALQEEDEDGGNSSEDEAMPTLVQAQNLITQLSLSWVCTLITTLSNYQRGSMEILVWIGFDIV